MKNLKLLRVAMLTAVAMAVPSFLYASTLTYETVPATTSIPLTTTDWESGSGTPSVPFLDIPQFDTSLGTLNSVTLTLTGSLNTRLTVQNITGLLAELGLGSPESSSGSVSTQSVVTVSDPSDLLSQTFNIISPSFSYAGLPGTTDSSSIARSGPLAATMSGSDTYTDPTLLAEFSGLGSVQLSASTNTGTLLFNTGGNSISSQETSAGLSATVTYNYTSPITVTPEPSTIALLGVGAIGLMGYVWRNGRRRWSAGAPKRLT